MTRWTTSERVKVSVSEISVAPVNIFLKTVSHMNAPASFRVYVIEIVQCFLSMIRFKLVRTTNSAAVELYIGVYALGPTYSFFCPGLKRGRDVYIFSQV